MKTVGIKELKNRTTQILKEVRENQEEFIVTLNGDAVAALRPIPKADVEKARLEKVEALLFEAGRIAKDVGARWKGEESSADAISNDRRS